MHFHTGTHVVAQLFGMSVNLDTIFTQWLTALIVFIIVFAASRGAFARSKRYPERGGNGH